MKKITFLKLVTFIMLLFTTTISFSQVTLPLEPACSFSGCTAGDLTIKKAYIALDNDVPLPACTSGTNVNAFLYLQVNTGPKYNIYVQFDLFVNGVKVNGSDKYTYADPNTNSLIPNTPIKIAPISFTCGDVIELKNIYVSWKTGGAKSNPASCAGIGGSGSKCAKASSVPDIVVNTPISPNFTVNKSCDGGDYEKVVFTNTSTGGDGTLTYLWDFDGGVSNLPLTNEGPHTVVFASGGSKNISLTVTDSDNEVAVKNTVITIESCCVDTVITTDVSDPSPVCAGSPIGALTVSASGTGAISYQWYSNTSASTTGGTLINGATTSSYTPTDTTAGTYYYYVVASSDCSTATSSVATVVVNSNTAITTDVSDPSPVCAGSPIGTLTVSASGTGT
ncbi:hypothetical protein, partial [uncultured Lutibacter sp.]|uniref:immunoglobulin domain-containing protein n=1 Tax=uncultured Lutibacter sp. TaxID=437739 RepID=UPI0026039E7E